ncbi:HPP family protein [Sphingomonas jeddahensis]|uniref:HPP family protein n=1 Tax=Sphingomonas jeddahensis TaxID=1915074 RepID=UPI00097828B1|nr:HPP family protein [Sphingomonas jeddahensis]
MSRAFPALSAALVVALIAAVAVITGQPWLFPSLGPTVFLQTVTSEEQAARPWNTVAGHAVGAAAALIALFLCDAQTDPAALASGTLTVGRAAATAVAIGLTIAGQQLIRAQHPPAAATTMLLTLGALQLTPSTAAALIAGVALAAALGEIARRLHPKQRDLPATNR